MEIHQKKMKHMRCVTIDCVLMCYEYCLDDLFCLLIDTLYIVARSDNLISSYANCHHLVARYIF